MTAAPFVVESREYRWASESGANGMATPDELVWLGYEPAMRDGQPCAEPRWPGTWLYVRVASLP